VTSTASATSSSASAPKHFDFSTPARTRVRASRLAMLHGGQHLEDPLLCRLQRAGNGMAANGMAATDGKAVSGVALKGGDHQSSHVGGGGGGVVVGGGIGGGGGGGGGSAAAVGGEMMLTAVGLTAVGVEAGAGGSMAGGSTNDGPWMEDLLTPRQRLLVDALTPTSRADYIGRSPEAQESMRRTLRKQHTFKSLETCCGSNPSGGGGGGGRWYWWGQWQ
jgi:hypothetical protein